MRHQALLGVGGSVFLWQLLTFLASLQRHNFPETALCLMGMGLSLLLITETHARRLTFRMAFPNLLWFATAWFCLQLLTAVQQPDALAGRVYLSHLILIGVLYVGLPLRQAGPLSLLSVLALCAAALTRSQVDLELLSSILLMGLLTSFLTVFGHSFRTERRADAQPCPALHLSALPYGYVTLSQLQAIVDTTPGSADRTALVLFDLDSATDEAALNRLAQQVQGTLHGRGMTCRWGRRGLLLVLSPACPNELQQLLVELRELHSTLRTDGLPGLYRGRALLSEGGTLSEALALAQRRLAESRRIVIPAVS